MAKPQAPLTTKSQTMFMIKSQTSFMKSVLFIVSSIFLAILLFLLIMKSPSDLKAHDGDESCPPSNPQSACAVFNPDPSRCIAHSVCTGGISDHFCCAVPTPVPTTPPACISDGQCIGPGEICCSGTYDFDTTCYATETRCGTAPCGADDELCCLPGLTCDPGLSCNSRIGRCTTSCSSDPDCDSGEVCQFGSCVPTGGGSSGLSPQVVNCGGSRGIQTAIGCIPLENTNRFLGFILSWGIGIAGGIAFTLIIVAAFQITTSSGDPKKLQAGRELMTSAIAGLVLLIFSVLILRIIGVNILGIPGFGS